MDAEAYIRASSLWIKRPSEEPQELVPASAMTPETLAQPYEDDFWHRALSSSSSR